RRPRRARSRRARRAARTRRRRPRRAVSATPGLSAGAERNGAERTRYTRFVPGCCPATLSLRADVAELVDAHGSGPCGRKLVEVQVLSSALLDVRAAAGLALASFV